MNTSTRNQYLRTMETMKTSSRDRIGTLGDLGMTGIGVTGGLAASGTIAAAAGATTLLGSSTLASLLGGIFVASTPIGWIIGSAVAGGAIAYGAGTLVRSGANNDASKAKEIRALAQRIRQTRPKTRRSLTQERKNSKLRDDIRCLVANKHLSQNKATALLGTIQKRHLSLDDACDMVQRLRQEKLARPTIAAKS